MAATADGNVMRFSFTAPPTCGANDRIAAPFHHLIYFGLYVRLSTSTTMSVCDGDVFARHKKIIAVIVRPVVTKNAQRWCICDQSIFAAARKTKKAQTPVTNKERI